MSLYVMLWLLSIVLIRAYLTNVFDKPLAEGEQDAVNWATVLGGLITFTLFGTLWYFFEFAPRYDW